jgi:hypothetical protein
MVSIKAQTGRALDMLTRAQYGTEIIFAVQVSQSPASYSRRHVIKLGNLNDAAGRSGIIHVPPWNQIQTGHPPPGICAAGVKARAWQWGRSKSRMLATSKGADAPSDMMDGTSRTAGSHSRVSDGWMYLRWVLWKATYSLSRLGKTEGWMGW